MSSPSVKPDSGSKVLPGDKTGLPWEIWRIILSYLSAEDLCRSSCVCKTWNDLVHSLDNTRWRELYLDCTEWKHPFWPLNTDSEPSSWKQAYKDQYTSKRFWTKYSREPETSNCLFVLKRRKERKIIRVGRGMEHSTLKSALAVANPYDKIEVHPGIYDEQFEMSSKIPFEIIGQGELGSVILVVCIEQVALTGRISNLVFRAPWFTNFILKVRSGYLQVDNCILEDGMVYVQNPGSCHLKYSTFRHATVILQHLNSSIIENCEFSQTDSAAVTVEGYPKDEKSWAYGYITEKMNSVCKLRPIHHNKGSETAPTSAFSYSTANQNLKSYDLKTDTMSSIYPGNGGRSMCSSAHYSTAHADQLNCSLPTNGFHSLEFSKSNSMLKSNCDSKLESCLLNYNDGLPCSNSSECSYLGMACPNSDVQNGSTETQSFIHERKTSFDHMIVPSEFKSDHKPKLENKGCSDLIKEKLPDDNEKPGPSNESKEKSKPKIQVDSEKECSKESEKPQESEDVKPGTSSDSQEGQTEFDPSKSLPELLVHSLSVGRGQSITPSGASSSRSNTPISVVSGSDFFEDDSLPVSDSDDNFSSSEESVIMLSCPEHHQPRSISAAASVGSDVQSICSQNQSYHIKIVEDTAMRKVLNEVRGCLISRCRISQCKGGIMVSLQAHAIISQCDISGVVCLKNEIHHCRTSGIFMRLAASGLIAVTEFIMGNVQALLCLVVAEGRLKTTIFSRTKKLASIFYIEEIHMSGIVQVFMCTIEEIHMSGIVQVFMCTIEEIHMSGIVQVFMCTIEEIHGSGIVQNVICNGLSDGIVIGEKGRGSIENNVISGNAGCGVWITAACQPMVHGNQINNNGDAGVTFVNRMDAAHETDQMIIDRTEMHSQRSVEFWQFINDEPVHPRRKCTRATVEYNSIYHNNSKGITVQYGDEILIQCNAVHGNRGNGISLDQTSIVVVKDNSVTCNAGNGIITTATGKVSIQGNGVFDNRDYGISSQCEVIIEENDVIGNQRSAIQLDKNRFLTVKKNRLQSLNDKAIVLNSIEGGEVQNNEIFTVRQDPVQVSKDCKCQVKDNKVITADPRNKNCDAAASNKSSKDFSLLKDPPARPHIEAPPTIPIVPSNQISTVTRVTVPSDGTCEEGSKL
ncbi:hypothetical protein KUTeg_000564, partial [Tegillarca granosa]